MHKRISEKAGGFLPGNVRIQTGWGCRVWERWRGWGKELDRGRERGGEMCLGKFERKSWVVFSSSTDTIILCRLHSVHLFIYVGITAQDVFDCSSISVTLFGWYKNLFVLHNLSIWTHWHTHEYVHINICLYIRLSFQLKVIHEFWASPA